MSEYNGFGGHFITTYSGKKFHYLDPQPDEIDIIDIAHQLSLTCRFAGACREFYSVAQHSYLMTNLVPDEYKLHALLHDASEAYMPDLPRPMKADLPKFKEMEATILWAIWDKYELLGFSPKGVIKEADNIMLATEAKELMANTDGWAPLPEPSGIPIIPTSSRLAENLFLYHFNKLTDNYKGKGRTLK